VFLDYVQTFSIDHFPFFIFHLLRLVRSSLRVAMPSIVVAAFCVNVAWAQSQSSINPASVYQRDIQT